MNKNFNIQLFAENLNTTATMSKEMKTFYEKRLIDQAEPRLVHDQFADYYPVPQNGGKTIEFRKYDSLPADRGRDPERSGTECDHHHQRSAPVRRLDSADRRAADDRH